jgi:hypothetical protein
LIDLKVSKFSPQSFLQFPVLNNFVSNYEVAKRDKQRLDPSFSSRKNRRRKNKIIESVRHKNSMVFVFNLSIFISTQLQKKPKLRISEINTEI